jgi:uncharacterized protein YqhQ
MSEAKTNVGGQAVLEGVMMRSPRCFAVAVRRKSGEIVIREQPWEAAWISKAAKIPFVRGVVTMVESMHNGYSALQFSAEQMEKDLAAEEAASNANDDSAEAVEARREVDAVAPSVQARVEAIEEAAAVTADAPAGGTSGAGTRLAMIVAIGFFVALPHLLALAAGKLLGPHWGDTHNFRFHALAGFFKLAVLLTYLSLIRRVPDIKRVFQYHGAEHKAIATYEAREPLTVEYARKHSTRHARCGTTFLIVVVMVSVLVYAAVLPPLLGDSTGVANFLRSMVIKIACLPLIAGFAYELQRFGAKFTSNPIAKIFLAPGYWVQGITTIEPSDDQLEIALASLRVTLVREAESQKPVSEPVVQSYPSYAAFAAEYGGAAYNGTAGL